MKKAESTVLYTFGGGRLGNQLVRFAHWLAWTLEHEGKASVIDAGFWRYARHFDHWQSRRGCTFPVSMSWADLVSRTVDGATDGRSDRFEQRVLRLLHAAGGFVPGWQQMGSMESLAEIDLADPEFLKRTEHARVTACAGWRIASWPLLAKHDTAVRRLLVPRTILLERCAAYVRTRRLKADLVAGVLIRHGDYRQWWGGRFHFETSHYAERMRAFVDQHPGRQVAFIVTSDEVQSPAHFAGLDVTFAPGSANAGGEAVEAMFTLASCDAILAPPSTFAAWASHWGRVPWWPIADSAGSDDVWQPVCGDLAAARVHPYLSLVVA